jgi:hypothetical protein
MCDYSLQSVTSRPAKVGDELVVSGFGTGTRGFTPAKREGDEKIAVCVLPGTEIAFDEKIVTTNPNVFSWSKKLDAKTAVFRQINKDRIASHHDALELPDGKIVLLTLLETGQHARVLQLPAKPRNKKEKDEQTRVETVA